MSPTQIEEKGREIREKYPEMFTHSELQEGEIYLGDVVCDVADVHVAIYRKNGLPSTRLGNSFLREHADFQRELKFYPIFASLHEFIIEDSKHEQRTPQ